MFSTLTIALLAAVGLFVAYLMVRAYKPSWFGARENFQQQAAPSIPLVDPIPPPPTENMTNSPPAEASRPAPAPPQKQDAPEEPRVVSPGGPNPPNAAPPAGMRPTLSPDAVPLDPYDDRNMEAPIHDSMRHPELSFGPGVDNTGMNKMALSGVGSARATAAESPFSPEYAQNGGLAMGSILANDLTKGDQYASA